MALPNVSSYLAQTRRPLDLVGPAINAFTAVSSEMRQTRAQNLAEEQDARRRGQEIKHGLQENRMFTEELMNMAQERDIQEKEFGMDQTRFALDMRERQFKYDNLLPLEVQTRQANLERQEQIYQAEGEKMRTEKYIRGIGNANMERLNGIMSGDSPVPEGALYPDEDPESNRARLRAAHGMIGAMRPMAEMDPVFAARLTNAQAILEADPEYQEMKRGGTLLLPEEKEARNASRETRLRVGLPGNDAWNEQWLREHGVKGADILNIQSDQDFDSALGEFLEAAREDWKEHRTGGAPDVDRVEQRGLNNAARDAEADVAALEAEVRSLQSQMEGMSDFERNRMQTGILATKRAELESARITLDIRRRQAGMGGGSSGFSGTAAPPPATPSSPPPPLRAGEDGRVAPEALRSTISHRVQSSRLNRFVPADGKKYGITTGSPAEWARLFDALAVVESGHRTGAKGDKGKYTGGSNGLFQLSPEDGVNHSELEGFGRKFTQEELRDPEFNAQAALRIAEKLVGEDGKIGSAAGEGMARYWGPLRSDRAANKTFMAELKKRIEADAPQTSDGTELPQSSGTGPEAGLFPASSYEQFYGPGPIQ